MSIHGSPFDPYPQRRETRPIISPWLLLVFLAGLALVLAGLAYWLWPRQTPGLDPTAVPRVVTPTGVLTLEEELNISVYEKAAPSVVHVINLTEARDRFTMNLQKVQRGTGTGIIWSDKGFIITNYHVVEGASVARVILSDHSSYETRQIWGYPDKDLAVLRIEAPASKLKPILVGSSSDLKVGQKTWAIGNPFGLDHSLSTGIISALDREIQSPNDRTIEGVIQTTATINPGNSGGPLLDRDARLIGVNTAILSPSGTFAGIGFAIPVDEVNRVIPQLIASGRVTRPQLGVRVFNDRWARDAGVEQGAVIYRVVPGTAAERAGLRGTTMTPNGELTLGDIIVQVGDRAVETADDLFNALEKQEPGQSVTITIIRDGKKEQIDVFLEGG